MSNHRIRPGLGKRLLLIPFGLLLALLLAEGLLHLFWSSLETPDDVVTKHVVGPRTFGGRGFSPIPGATFSSRYDGDPYDTLPDGDEVTYQLNELGFRDAPFPPHGPAGDPQIVVIGDSFVFAEGVERKHRLTEVCSRHLRQQGHGRARVLNLGVSGFASEDEAHLATAFLPDLTPRVVVVGYCLNDPVHFLDPSYGKRLGFDLVMRRDVEPWKGDPKQSPSCILRLIRRKLKIDRKTEATARWYQEMYDGPTAPWTKSRAYLLAIREEARKRGAETAVLIMPIFYRLNDGYPFAAIHELVGAWCRSNDIEVLDTLDVLRGRDTRTLIVHPKDRHPNAEAHKLMGKALADFLQERIPRQVLSFQTGKTD